MSETRNEVDEIIDRNLFRQDVYELVPAGTERILDFGCNEGELLLRLRRDKGCKEIYGIDVIDRVRPILDRHLDGGWVRDLHHWDLDPKYQRFFNYVLMHDVVEHLYDPWFVMAKLRNCLAPGGKLVVVVPNFRYWHFWSQIILGEFRYGAPGGLMNEEHIRWFTLA
ncbi:MAG TPA: methyltransferase domain-containing protein, partial [Polyangiaceae bacterium]